MTSPRKFREILNLAYQRFNALQRGEKRCFGVTMSQCVALETLHREGPMPVRELSQRLGLDTSTVTRLVDVLVRDGMAQRARDEAGDRRRVFVSLSETGLRAGGPARGLRGRLLRAHSGAHSRRAARGCLSGPAASRAGHRRSAGYMRLTEAKETP